jgi:hypothetical protein
MFFNRRKHERALVKDYTVTCDSRSGSYAGQVMDISEGGMRVEMERVPAMHEKIILHMTDDNGLESTRKAVVVWFIVKTPPDVGAIVGIQFIS